MLNSTHRTRRREATGPSGLATMAAALLLAGGTAPAFGALTGQWDFENGNLNGTVGAALDYGDGIGGETQAATRFGTTTTFGIPNIGGQEAKVMQFGTNTIPAGYFLPAPASGNGGGSQVNQWTLILDVLYPAVSNSRWRAIIETDNGNTADADFFVNTGNGIGSGSYSGVIQPNTWHRIGIVVDAAKNEMRKYIDGVQVGVQAGVTVDGRWALSAGGVATLFADDNGETAGGYVNSIQLYNNPLSKGQMLALGAPTAAGLPQTLPPVPSSIENWIPAGAYAARTTSIGAVINPGDTTIQDSTITLALDGQTVSSPSITRADGLIKVEKTNPGLTLGKHQLVVSFTDSAAGARSLTNEFTAALFFEDFESVTLLPTKDEPAQFEAGWTHTPPAGWSVDNSQFIATLINPETNPDSDGDGYADEDGRTEWAGWSFASKEFWLAADRQRREEFELAQGKLAIADPDEWDDMNHVESLFNSFLTTPPISLTGLAPNTVFLTFASSWRPEARDDGLPKFPVDENGAPINNQTAIITAKFDNGEPIQILKWDSVSGSPTFHTDMPNESVLVSIPNPAGAQNMVLTFALVEAANDWWWAVDNIAVSAGGAPPIIAQQPKSTEVNEGSPLTLTVEATGEGLAYQWYKGKGTARTLIQGATAASYTIAAATMGDAGSYSVEIKNTVGAVNSDFANVSVLPLTSGRLVLLSENFDGLPLGPNVDEGVAGDQVWTKTPPAGWTIDDSGVPGAGDPDQDGVTEWAGWSFANREWWALTGGDQERTKFTKGTGTSAIVDSDEWDDVAHAAGNMASYLKTKAISLDGTKPNSVIVQFDSSWRPESPQKANVTVSFDGGAPIEVLRFESEPASANYRPDSVNETIAFQVPNPAGARQMTLTFGYFDTRNNWWWAFDNLLVLADKAALFTEDFEGLVLGPNVEEGITTGSGGAKPNVWTKTAPAGWTIDDTGVPGVGTDQDGVTEWAGWSFANREWWASTAGDQDRTKFLKGVGTVAIADSDEWDDIAHAAGNMATFLTTRAIDITGQAANTVYLKFDSSWRAEEPQKANIRVSYDGGAPVEVLRWISTEGQPNYHPDAVNETVTLPLLNPAGAKSLTITFGYFDTRNNWWWAIDNLEVSVGPAVSPAPKLNFALGAGQLTLTWEGSGYALEQADALGNPAGWSAVPGAGANSATVPTTDPAKYYRLKK